MPESPPIALRTDAKPSPPFCYPTALFGVTCCTDRGGTFEKSGSSPSSIVGCARTASRSLEYGRFASIAVCTAAMTSPASEPIIVKPRIRSSSPTRAFMKPCLSSVVCVRSTALIGSLATRTETPWRCASLSVNPTRASGGSVNMQYGISRSRVLRFPPARLSLMMRKSSTDTCVNCGLLATVKRQQDRLDVLFANAGFLALAPLYLWPVTKDARSEQSQRILLRDAVDMAECKTQPTVRMSG